MTTDQAVKSFLKAAIADGLRAATIKWYQSLLNGFEGIRPQESDVQY